MLGRKISSRVSRTVYLILLIGIFIDGQEYCFSFDTADRHVRLWYHCLGVSDTSSQRKLQAGLIEFSNRIDGAREVQGQELQIKLKSLIPDLQPEVLRAVRSLHHRCFFHWGFSVVDPGSDSRESCRMFRTQIDNHLGDLRKQFPKLTEDTMHTIRETIFRIVKKEWIQRNQDLHRITRRSFFRALPHDRITALAAFLYEVHILADYTTRYIKPLGCLEDHVEKDLIGKGIRPLFRGTRSREAAADLEKSLVGVISGQCVRGNIIDEMLNEEDASFRGLFMNIDTAMNLRLDQRRALKVILILKRRFPEMFYRSFGKTLAENSGIVISY